jgi:hypothetical protein
LKSAFEAEPAVGHCATTARRLDEGAVAVPFAGRSAGWHRRPIAAWKPPDGRIVAEEPIVAPAFPEGHRISISVGLSGVVPPLSALLAAAVQIAKRRHAGHALLKHRPRSRDGRSAAGLTARAAYQLRVAVGLLGVALFRFGQEVGSSFANSPSSLPPRRRSSSRCPRQWPGLRLTLDVLRHLHPAMHRSLPPRVGRLFESWAF